MSEEDKQKRENIKKIDIKICLNKRKENERISKK